MTFHALHVELLLGDIYAVWVSPLPAKTHNNDSLINDRADPGGVSANGGARRCRHPFGFYNPPEVWKAHGRLVIRVGDSMDQDLVNAYVANQSIL